MVATAQSLVRELATRMGEFYLSTPTGGSVDTLVDANLDQYWPQTVGQYSAAAGFWVYGGATAIATANRGVERRALSYTQSSHTLTFLASWPGVISGGNYEMHWRTPRSRKLEAINSAIRQLGFHWARSMLSEAALTTVVNQWSYNLPTGIQWGNIERLQIQINTTGGLTGYPYADAGSWNWSIIPYTDDTGVTAFRLQFGTLPPPGRIIRIIADVGYNDLVTDTDVLPLDTSKAGIALEWIYSWAIYQLNRWESIRQPPNQTAWLEQQAAALLKEASDIRDRFASTPGSTRVVTPGSGTADWPSGAADDPAYLAAFNTIH